jgi:hypothetical protein
MAGWGFDFSQVSLSGIGEKLSQLAADAESSIDSQMRADRLGLVEEEPAKKDEGGLPF